MEYECAPALLRSGPGGGAKEPPPKELAEPWHEVRPSRRSGCITTATTRRSARRLSEGVREMRYRRIAITSAVLAGLLASQPLAATDNTDRKWDKQQYGIYDYSPCYYYESDFPTGDARNRVSDARANWNNAGRELYFRYATGCAKAIYVKWDHLQWPFNDDYAFVENDHWGDISSSRVNFNASPDKSGGGTYSWYWGTGTVPRDRIDGWSVALHEFGHVVALGHTKQSTSDVMYPYLKVGQMRRSRTAHDYQSISKLYAKAQ